MIARISILLFFLFQGFTSQGQEIKLGLPLGHTSIVNEASFSPDNKLVVTASEDGTAKIYDVSSGALIHSLEGHTKSVLSAHFSPNGKYVVTASWDGNARIFKVQTGSLLHILKGHSDWVNSAQFSHDSKYVVTASNDYVANIYEVASGSLVHSLSEHTSNIQTAEFSADGKYVVTASWDNTAKIFSSSTGRLVHSLDTHTYWLNSAQFSTDGKRIVTASDDGSVKVFNTLSGIENLSIDEPSINVKGAQFSPDGKWIATLTYDTLRLYNSNSGALIHVFDLDYIHYPSNKTMQFSPNGQYIIVACNGNNAKLIDVSSGTLIQDFKDRSYRIQSVQFSPNGQFVVTASSDQTAKIFDVSTGKLLKTFESKTSPTNSAEFSPDGSLIALATGDSIVQVINRLTGKITHFFDDHTRSINNVAFDPTGNLIASASNDNTVKIYSIVTGKLIHDLVCGDEEHWYLRGVNSAQFSPSGKFIITASNDNIVRLFNSVSGELLKTYELPFYEEADCRVKSIHFSPDEKHFVTAWDECSIVFEMTSKDDENSKSFCEYQRSANSAQFSPDGKKIVSAYDKYWQEEDYSVKVFDVLSEELIHSLDGHTDNVNSAQFSNDGNLIVTASDDNTINVFETSSGDLIQTLSLHSANINTAQFSRDKKEIVASCEDGGTIIYDFVSGEEIIKNYQFNSDPNKWVHLHPSGLFDASAEAMDMMYWTKGLEVIQFDQLKDRYWLPGLWKKVMSGERLPNVRSMDKLKLQPLVEIGEIEDDIIPILLKKRDGGYGKVSIFVNGKEVAQDARGEGMDTTKTEQTLLYSIKDHPYLVDGENKIEVQAASSDGFVVGRRTSTGFSFVEDETDKPQFYGVVVGVSDYANEMINLKYPVEDAQAITQAFQMGAENLFGVESSHIYSIHSQSNDVPNKQNIKHLFDEVSKKATANDVFVVYLSGHGINWGSGDQADFFFLTSDATAAAQEAYHDPAIRANNTISTAEWVEWINDVPALKQVMIIDACGSGQAVENLIEERNVEASQIKAIDRMKDRTGMYIISGCAANSVSYEASQYGQGLLTYSILQAMQGAALKENKFVDVFTIMDYSREAVPKLAAGIGGIQKPQLLIPRGGSFDIGILEPDDQAAIPISSKKTVYVRSTLVEASEFEDVLSLSVLLDDALSNYASKRKRSRMVFFDAANFPDACKISGGYNVQDNTISLTMKLRCGEDVKTKELSAANKEELMQLILDNIEK